jgi:hypothetical protein
VIYILKATVKCWIRIEVDPDPQNPAKKFKIPHLLLDLLVGELDEAESLRLPRPGLGLQQNHEHLAVLKNNNKTADVITKLNTRMASNGQRCTALKV